MAPLGEDLEKIGVGVERAAEFMEARVDAPAEADLPILPPRAPHLADRLQNALYRGLRYLQVEPVHWTEASLEIVPSLL